MQGLLATADRGLDVRNSPRRRLSRTWLFGLSFLIAITVLLPAPSGARAYSDGYIDTDVLNLRTGPGIWADVIDRMWQYEYVGVLDGPTDDGWYEVDYYGTTGWAYGGYLMVDGSPGWAGDEYGGVFSSGATGSAWVDTDSLNMRTWASGDAGVVEVLTQGDEVYVTGGSVNGYVPVTSRGLSAWVWNGYLAYGGPTVQRPERWIDIDRSTQTVTLYEGDGYVASYWAALGWDDSASGFYATAIGTYYVYSKYSALNWTEWGQAYIRSWVGFDASRVNGFHSWSMDANGNVLPNGDGPTGGCVALEPSAAAYLYDFVGVGTRVEVHW